MYSRTGQDTLCQMLVPCSDQPAHRWEDLLKCTFVAKKHLLNMQV